VLEKERKPAKRASDSSFCTCPSETSDLSCSVPRYFLWSPPDRLAKLSHSTLFLYNDPLPPFYIHANSQISVAVVTCAFRTVELAIFPSIRASLLLDCSYLPLECSPAYPHMCRAAPAMLVNGVAIYVSSNAALPHEQYARTFYCIACCIRTCTAQWCRRLYV
jgi:hypothetical protein